MSFEIIESMLVQLKRKSWYYNTKKKTRKNYPDGGFLKKGEHLLVCEVLMTDAGVIKIKMLHNKNNTVHMIMDKEDTGYFFEETFTCK